MSEEHTQEHKVALNSLHPSQMSTAMKVDDHVAETR